MRNPESGAVRRPEDLGNDHGDLFDLVDIREIPDDQLEDLLGGVLGPMKPLLKAV
jgi:hypothetical protein